MTAQRSGDIRRNLDWSTLLIMMSLVLFGWITIYSAAFNPEHAAIFDFKSDHGKQLIWIGICAVIGLVLLNTEGEFFIRFRIL